MSSFTDKIWAIGCERRILGVRHPTFKQMYILPASLQEYGLPDPVRIKQYGIFDNHRLVGVVRIHRHLDKYVKAVSLPDVNITKRTAFSSVYIDTESALSGISKRHRLNTQIFVVWVIDLEVFRGRANRS